MRARRPGTVLQAAPSHHTPAPPPVADAGRHLREALALLAGALAEHGEPSFERFGVPSLRALGKLDAATAADWTILLVHAVFHGCRPRHALTVALKGAGTAALGVRRALAREAARSARIALREMAPALPKRRPGNATRAKLAA
jgi:hypothetical protein